jgi:hypothetical protein
MCKITHLAERNEWKVQDNHLDAFMDDTSSLPTTNIINDRLKFFLVIFFFKKKGSTKNLQRSRITRTNSLKDQTQAITSDWPIKKNAKRTMCLMASRVRLLSSSLFCGFILFQSFKSFSFAISSRVGFICIMLGITITLHKKL